MFCYHLLDEGSPAVDHLDPAVVVVGLEVAELLLLHGGHIRDLIEGGLLSVGGHRGRQLQSTDLWLKSSAGLGAVTGLSQHSLGVIISVLALDSPIHKPCLKLVSSVRCLVTVGVGPVDVLVVHIPQNGDRSGARGSGGVIEIVTETEQRALGPGGGAASCHQYKQDLVKSHVVTPH